MRFSPTGKNDLFTHSSSYIWKYRSSQSITWTYLWVSSSISSGTGAILVAKTWCNRFSPPTISQFFFYYIRIGLWSAKGGIKYWHESGSGRSSNFLLLRIKKSNVNAGWSLFQFSIFEEIHIALISSVLFLLSLKPGIGSVTQALLSKVALFYFLNGPLLLLTSNSKYCLDVISIQSEYWRISAILCWFLLKLQGANENILWVDLK